MTSCRGRRRACVFSVVFQNRVYCSGYPSATYSVPHTAIAKDVAVSQTEIAPSVSRNTEATLVQPAGQQAGAVVGSFANLAVFQQCVRTSPGPAAMRTAVAGLGEAILE